MLQSLLVAPLNGARLGSGSGSVLSSRDLPVRAEPSSTKGRNSFRPWSGDLPPLELLADTPGSHLTPLDLRKLGRQAVRVWVHLMDLRGHAVRPVRVSLRRVVLDLAIAERTLDRAMARLKDAALVDAMRWRVMGDRWVSVLSLTVHGAREVVRGQERLWAPDQTIMWCDRARAQGRPRKLNLALTTQSSDAGNQDLAPNPGAPNPEKHTYVEGYPVVSQQQGHPPPAGEVFLEMKKQKAIYIQTPTSTSVMPMKLEGDPTDPATQTIWVRQLAQAYNLACREVFGREGRCFLPDSKQPVSFSTWSPGGGTTKATPAPETKKDALRSWKFFQPLLAAATALHEHGLSPLAWATWTMRMSHASQLRTSKKPLARPVNAVFVAAHIDSAKRRGFFHRTTEHGHGVKLEITKVHEEQLCRMRERDRRARGITHHFGLPDWYAKLREQEVAQGVTDPLERFPWTKEGKR